MKLFIGALSWNTDSMTLGKAFEKFGAVREAKVITDRDTGRSKGFGFVTFETKEAATAAIVAMDGSSLDGRTIRVTQAEEKPRPAFGGGGGGYTRPATGYDRPGGFVQEVVTTPARPTRDWGPDSPKVADRKKSFGGQRGGRGGTQGWDD